MRSTPFFLFRLTAAWLLPSALLLGGCGDSPDATNGTGITALPLNMMAPLHTMAQNSQAVPATGQLDEYFARLMRENHRAAVAMSALELNRGRDPDLLRLAENINHAHQQQLLGLDSVLTRLRARPDYPDNSTGGQAFTRLLEAATNGLAPAAHRSIEQAEGGIASPNLGMREYLEDAGTGSIDRDFAVLLIPHHQNSMALAQAEMEYGRDAQLQQIAYQVVRDQQREIDQAAAWLAQHPAPTR